jgi:hypothetical protein
MEQQTRNNATRLKHAGNIRLSTMTVEGEAYGST